MSSIKDICQDVIKNWNLQVLESGRKEQYELTSSIREKKFYINRKDFTKQRIAEITLYETTPIPLMLWRRELPMPDKIVNTPQHQLEGHFSTELYKSFLYECMGVFCVFTKQGLERQDIAEYDIKKDRLKQHESAVDMIVQTIVDGPFFVKGNEFDVFMCTDEYYFVYTQHDIGRKNNGIARLKKDDCLVTQNAKVKIILDY